MASRQLWHDDQIVPIENKVLDFLIYLVDHRNRAVSKEELHKVLWKNRPLSDTVMARCVMKVRKAVNDDGQRQGLIKTVPTYGYRFIAKLTTKNCSNQAVASTGVTPDELQDAGYIRSKINAIRNTNEIISRINPYKYIAYAFSFVTLLAISYSLYIHFYNRVSGEPVKAVVLPVQNNTNDDSLDWVNLGLMIIVEQGLSRNKIKTIPFQDIMTNISTVTDASDAVIQEAVTTLKKSALSDETYIVDSALEWEHGLFRINYVMHQQNNRKITGELIAENAVELAEILGERIAHFIDGKIETHVAIADVSGDESVQSKYLMGLNAFNDGKYGYARELYESALGKDPGADWIRLELAKTEYELGNWDRACIILEGLLDSTESLQDRRLAIVAHDLFGHLELELKNLPHAENYFNRALALIDEYQEQDLSPMVLTHIGKLKYQSGDFEAARELFQKSLLQANAMEVEYIDSVTLQELAWLSYRQGDLDQAMDYSTQALQASYILSARAREITSLNALGTTNMSLGKMKIAETYYSQALKLSQGTDNRQHEALTLHHLSQLKLRWGDIDGSLEYIEKAIRIAGEAHLAPYMLSNMIYQRANSYVKQGKYDKARADFEQIFITSNNFDDTFIVPVASLKLGYLGLITNNFEEAILHAETVLDTANAIGDQYLKANALKLKGNIAHASNQLEQAMNLYWEAMVIAESIEFPRLLAGLKLDMGYLCLQINRTGLTKVILDKLKSDNVIFQWLFLEARMNYKLGNYEKAVQLQILAKEQAGQTWTQYDEKILNIYQQSYKAGKPVPINDDYIPFFIS